MTQLLAQATTRTYYDWARLHMMTQWWHWMALLVVCLSVILYVSLLYRRDSVDLPRGIRWTLLLLRVVALLGLLIFFLNLEKRTEKKLVKNSRVVVLVDTSSSMDQTDANEPGASTSSRIAQVAAWLDADSNIAALRKKHDVSVYRFDETNFPASIATYPKLRDANAATQEENRDARLPSRIAESKSLLLWAIGFLTAAVVCVVLHLVLGSRVRGAEGEAWSLLIAAVAAIVAFVFFAVSNLRQPDIGPSIAFGWESPAAVEPTEPASEQPVEIPVPEIKWAQTLTAQGTETRLGAAVRAIVDQERGGPIAGVVVMTDGANNSGIDHSIAASFAKEAGIKIFPIGVGSDSRPKNIRVVDVEAPRRVFPGDDFQIKAYVQANGIKPQQLNVNLVSRGDDESETTEVDEGDATIEIGADGQIQPVEFKVTPDAVGRRIYSVKVNSVANELNPDDNRMSSKVEIVERKNRVLLIAGGPNRDYRFLRTQLFRDKETTLHIILQTASPTTSQESDKILLDFPSTPNELFEYDCIVAFDPDWNQLDVEQIALLERWVAEKAGGLIVVAGPVHTTRWTRSRRGDSKLDPIRALYPVTFYSRLAASIQLGRSAAETPWPPQFTEEALSAEFLRIDDEAEDPLEAWKDFIGVYSYFAVKDAKPGATVFAYFSDPQTASDNRLPIYMAGQFFGAGRVFYMGSAEMWRLNSIDSAFFERFYTKLIRYVSQGRLLRDSSRGILIVDKDRCSRGDSVVVRAALSDAQFQPLKVDSVAATLVVPNEATGIALRQELTLRPIKQSSREGLYAGQFNALIAGDYVIELQIPDAEDEVLTREVRVSLPKREIEKPERNDAILSELATTTSGKYYVGLDAATISESPLSEMLTSRDQETYLPGSTDQEFEQRMMTWLLALICGTLSLEWLVRRLYKLA